MSSALSGRSDVAEAPDEPAAPADRSGPGRGAVLSAAGMLIVLLAALLALLPVPYVVVVPGPLTNTLSTFEGEPIIAIDGRATYPTDGRLDLTTVRVGGGPGRSMDLVTALRGWIDPRLAVVPEEQYYAPGTTEDQIEEQIAEQMNLSQVNATAAALRALDIPVTEVVVVQAVVEGSAALGVLRAGDVITRVDGAPVTTPEQVRDAVTAHEPGEQVRVTVERDGAVRSERLETRAAPDDPTRAVIGIQPDVSFEFPFEVDFSLERTGGPSAGMMFALGIIDKLTPGSINDGQYVAGTGTIAPDGTVGRIGGIQQKLVAAAEAGVDLFLAPADNCRQVAAATPDDLRVARVATLDDALGALEALREDRVESLPTCVG